jgi:integrase
LWSEGKIDVPVTEPPHRQLLWHYTLEEAEDLISALVNHVDGHLILALSCFLAPRPGEIAALKWEDF